MARGGYREEVLNTLLALLLHQRGVVTAPEQSLRQAYERRRAVPDLIVVFQGVRTAIEGKWDDQAGAAEEAFAQAQGRVDKGIAHIGMALLYPVGLRLQPFDSLMETLALATFRVAVYSEAGPTGWTEGGLDYLADLLRRTFEQLVQEDVVAQAVERLDAGIGNFARTVYTTPASIQKAAQILGIGEPPRRTRQEEEDEED